MAKCVDERNPEQYIGKLGIIGDGALFWHSDLVGSKAKGVLEEGLPVLIVGVSEGVANFKVFTGDHCVYVRYGAIEYFK